MNDIVRRYARLQVPRYTSYPTAAEFTADVAAADQLRWLAGVDTNEAVSLYLHVPYCRELCLYCGCNTKKAVRDDVIADYREALEREIALVGDAVSGPLRIARLHWGGGTPSILGPDGLASVMRVLRERFIFETGHEHAIELDPRYVTPALAEGLRQARRQPRQPRRAGRQSAGAGRDRPLATDVRRRGGRGAAARRRHQQI